MSWDVASQVATSVGALLAAASLAAGFVLYRLSQRDAQAAQFSQMIGVTRPNVDQLKRLVSYEMANDLATTTAYSRDLELPLTDFYEYCRPASGPTPAREEVVEYVRERFPAITLPLVTSLVEQYETRTTSIASDIAVYQATFPGVYRVINSMALLFRNVLRNEMELVRNEDIWRQFLPELIEDEERVTSLSHMKRMAADILTALVQRHMSGSREQIALVVEMLDITFETYLRMTPSDLKRVSRAERAEKVQPTSFTQTITEDLREAERCLRHALTAAQIDRYRELLAEFEKTGEEKDDQGRDEKAEDLAAQATSAA